MKPFLHLAGGAAIVGFVIVVAFASLLSGATLDFESIALESDRSCELDYLLFRCHERSCTMERLVQELSADEVSLAAAVGQSSELYEGDDVTLGRLREIFGGKTDNEVLCRQLVSRVSRALRRSPQHHDKVVPRLEAELRQLYPLTTMPVVDPNSWPTGLRREGYADPSAYDSINLGL